MFKHAKSFLFSAGIAPNTLMAKVCSDQKKPNGQFRLRDEAEVTEFVRTLPIRKVSGIGNVSEQLLTKALDVKTCGDMYRQRGLVRILFGQSSSHFFLRASLGKKIHTHVKLAKLITIMCYY